MDSIPPATMISEEPEIKRSLANIAAFIPEPHILLIVVQPAASGRPAPSEAWRAGAWPCPAGRTQPISTSCTSSGLIFARSTAARIAAAPSSGAAKPFSSPWKAPIGVRAADTMTIGSGVMERSFQFADRGDGFRLERIDELCRGKGAGERRALARPHRDEVGPAGFRGGLAQLAGDAALRREDDGRRARHLVHEAVAESSRELAGEFVGHPRIVFLRLEKRFLVHRRRAPFGAGDERGAELRGLR